MRRSEAAAGGLLEREESLDVLTRITEETLTGSGAVVTITGPPGIGKSSLLGAAAGIAAERGFRVTTASGGELEKDFPFGIVRQLFAPLVAGLGGNASGAQRVFESAARESPGEDSSYAVLRGLYWMVAQLAEVSPIAAVVDDSHWSDLATLRFIDYLSRRLEDLPVLVVLAARDAEPGSEDQLKALQSLADVRPIRPALLSKHATTRMLADRLGGKPDPSFADAAHQLTGGNPFLVGALADELVRMGVEPDAANVGRLTEVMPVTVEAGVAATLGRLGDQTAAVAEAVAVLGDQSPARLVSILLAAQVDEISAAADRLVQAGLFSNSRLLAYRHPLLRTAVLTTIPRARRSRLHADAATCLIREGADPSRAAAQLLHVEPRRDPDTANLLRLAARESTGRGSPESAVAFLQRALEEIEGRSPERPALLLELGTALGSLDPIAGAEVLTEAATTAEDPDVRNRAVTSAGHALCTAGRVREASALVEEFIKGVSDGGRPSARALARMAGELQWTIGQSFDEALRAARRYWDWADRVAEEAAVVAGGKAYVECVSQGDIDVARSLALEAAEGDALVRLLRPGDYGAMATVVALIATDELGAARALCGRLKDAAMRSGEPTGLANCAMWSAWVNAAYGDLMSAEVDATTALDITRATSQSAGVPATTVASVLVERGETTKAAAVVGEFAPAMEGDLDDRQKTMALIGRAGVRLAAGRFKEAARDLDRIAASNPRGGDRNPLLGWRALRAMALAAVGRTDEAAAEVAANLEHARRWGAPRSVCAALRIASRFETENARRLETLREAVEVCEKSQSRLERAKVEVALGSELRRQGHRVEARSRLKVGHEMASACGATGLAEFALAELVAGGARPRRPRSVGPDALTASERRVAEMASEGLTNREIAEALFVSVKTVTFHLTNCYRKLGVGSRAELARVIDRL